MPKGNRALVISISVTLVEELLKRYVKNVPEDLKIDSVNYEQIGRILGFYFKSEKFPVVKDDLRENVAAGLITVHKNADGTTTVTLKWKEPNKKKED